MVEKEIRVTFYYCRKKRLYIRSNAFKRHLKVCDGHHVYTRIVKDKVPLYVK